MHVGHETRLRRRSRSNRYDHLDRRVQKITPEATHTNSSTPNSSTRQFYIPWYDAFGNILGYCDAQGNVVATYTYDAFGKLVASSGPMADVFSHRYSTKYFDPETGLYYYIMRYYSPELMRWITRDPIGEEGGVNLYAFCENNPTSRYDVNGHSWLTCFGDCIEEWRLDWSELLSYSNLPLSFNAITPKTAKEQLWIKDGNSKYTTPISRAILRGQELALKLPRGRLRSSLLGSLRNLRHFMRNPILVGSGTIIASLTVFEGFYDIGVMTYCSMHCCGGD